MTKKKLEWNYLLPDIKNFTAVFQQPTTIIPVPLALLQARLVDGVKKFCHTLSPSRFMLLTAKEDENYFQLMAELVTSSLPALDHPIGSNYIVTDHGIKMQPALKLEDNFAARAVCDWQCWIEYHQLFGVLHYYHNGIDLQPGLVHQVNGGVLIIGARTIINQPILWRRLKQMIVQQRFDWLPSDESHPLPLSVPSMPLNLKVILLGDSEEIAYLNYLESDLTWLTLYVEFEYELIIHNMTSIAAWCTWVNMLAIRQGLTALTIDAWPIFIRQAMRYSGDQKKLPLCPQWLTSRLKEAAQYDKLLTAVAFRDSEQNRLWRENYLSKKIQQDIIDNQIMVETTGHVVGQVNALSVLEVPGHPQLFGTPSRISCVVHLGNGEINDVERKVELGGNLHAKGMMIMQAFLLSVLKLDQPLPFTASLVFEQSYNEIDGDSASLAILIALISALSDQPVTQQIAVTGSVDQFGRIQPIGSINEKIESFYNLCHTRGLTGSQGVILPTANISNLCLQDNVISSVRAGKFALWTVDTCDEALEILIAMPFVHPQLTNIITMIRRRIKQFNTQERPFFPWFMRWVKWFSKKNSE